MTMSPFSSDEEDGMMSEINMTPLVDVMLVLLIIFLVTIPAINHAVKIDLPKASSQPTRNRPMWTWPCKPMARFSGTIRRWTMPPSRRASRKHRG